MDDKQQLVDEEVLETASVTPPNPEARAFSGHPDHPPCNPDQTIAGNQELLAQSDGDAEAATEDPSG